MKGQYTVVCDGIKKIEKFEANVKDAKPNAGQQYSGKTMIKYSHTINLPVKLFSIGPDSDFTLNPNESDSSISAFTFGNQ